MALDDKIVFICGGNIPETKNKVCGYEEHYNSIICTYNEFGYCRKNYGNPCVEVQLWDAKENKNEYGSN